MNDVCEYCNTPSTKHGLFWMLYNYYGISGMICAKCYEKVEHTHGEPNNPKEYLIILLKQESKHGKAKET